MDIRNLVTNNRLDRTSSGKKVSSSRYDSTSKPSETSAYTQNESDKVSISSAATSDLEFAKQVYKKLEDTSFETVRSIRQKADQGFYHTDESVRRIATGLQYDLSEIESDYLKSTYEPTYPVDIEKLKQNLAENPEIISEVASRLSKILTNL